MIRMYELGNARDARGRLLLELLVCGEQYLLHCPAARRTASIVVGAVGEEDDVASVVDTLVGVRDKDAFVRDILLAQGLGVAGFSFLPDDSARAAAFFGVREKA